MMTASRRSGEPGWSGEWSGGARTSGGRQSGSSVYAGASSVVITVTSGRPALSQRPMEIIGCAGWGGVYFV